MFLLIVVFPAVPASPLMLPAVCVFYWRFLRLLLYLALLPLSNCSSSFLPLTFPLFLLSALYPRHLLFLPPSGIRCCLCPHLPTPTLPPGVGCASYLALTSNVNATGCVCAASIAEHQMDM